MDYKNGCTLYYKGDQYRIPKEEAERFIQSIEITQPGGHYVQNGSVEGGFFVLQARRNGVNCKVQLPTRQLIWVVEGNILKNEENLYTHCGEPECINPYHLTTYKPTFPIPRAANFSQQAAEVDNILLEARDDLLIHKSWSMPAELPSGNSILFYIDITK